MEIAWPSGWTVEIAPSLGGVRGLCLFGERRALIADGLHPWQRNATEQHEAIHAESGPVPPYLEAREERRVNRETARRLIPLDALKDALRQTQDADLAAAWLEVPVAMVWARLQGLTKTERENLRQWTEGAS